jgi:hypothetical protein
MRNRAGFVFVVSLALGGCGMPFSSDGLFEDAGEPALSFEVPEAGSAPDAPADAGDAGTPHLDGGESPHDAAADAAHPVEVDAADSAPPPDPDAACYASATTQPTPCFQATVTGPAQYGFSTTVGGFSCTPAETPPECQCAGAYTCDCLLASPFVPHCQNGSLPSCVISYPNLGGIVDLTCN